MVTQTHIQNIPRVANDRIYDVLWGVEAEEGSFPLRMQPVRIAWRPGSQGSWRPPKDFRP